MVDNGVNAIDSTRTGETISVLDIKEREMINMIDEGSEVDFEDIGEEEYLLEQQLLMTSEAVVESSKRDWPNVNILAVRCKILGKGMLFSSSQRFLFLVYSN